MPTISRFHGVVVFMNFNDHNPPHFHARYQDYEVTVEIAGGLVQGAMPRRELRMILEWSATHQTALLRNWEHARQREPLEPVPPLR